MATRIQRGQRKVVKRMSDRSLERIVGSKPGMRRLFKGVARMYRPDRSGG